jgi:putative oxidoreductase
MARLAPLVTRLALGVIFIAHGGQKMFGWWGGSGYAGTIAAFAKEGMPSVLTVLVMVGEFFGGLGVLVGCLTRIAALGPAIVMIGAIATVHASNGFFLNWLCSPARGHGIECNLGYLTLALSLVLTGAGPVSIDAVWAGSTADINER